MNKQIPPVISRLKVYFTERFPIIVYLPFVIILYFCLTIINQLLEGNKPIVDNYAIVGVISAFFFMLMIRTFDDLKDVELDHEIFPDRPVSRGAVLITDVKILAIISFVSLVLINVLMAPKTIVVFVIVMIYLLLTFKFFFTEKLHIKKPVVAMITHQPIPVSIIFFLIHTSLASGNDYNSFSIYNIALLFIFSLPVTAWEVSRKIKAKVNENKYETFSKILGPKIAAVIPIVFYTIATISAFILASKLSFSIYFYLAITLLLVLSSGFYIRFIQNPIPKNNNLKNVAVIFTSIFLVTILCFAANYYFVNY